MMSPKSSGLFHKVIIESPPSGLPYKDTEQAKRLGDDVRRKLFCREGDMECMRSKPLDAVLDVQVQVFLKPASFNLLELFENIGPVIDGDEVPADPMDASNKDKFRHYPTMIGTVTEETRPFIYEAWKFRLTKPEYMAVILATYPSHSVEIYDRYPPPEEVVDLRDALSMLYTDFLFTCPIRNTSYNLIRYNDTLVYRYVFDHALVYPVSWGSLDICKGHVCHAAELAFVFHNLINYTAEEDQLSNRMLSYWTNFAHTSDPNQGPNPNVAQWPRNNQKLLKYFKTPSDEIVRDYRGDFCDFWDSIGYDRLSLRKDRAHKHMIYNSARYFGP